MDYPFLSRLKDSIQDLHGQAQDCKPLDALISRNITEEEYIAILARLYGFVAPLDSLIARSIGDFGLSQPYAELQRSADLRRDLVYFGMTSDAIDALPCAPLMETLDLPRALGMLYLMEGSRMGGIIISRSLEESLDIDPDRGLAYFTSPGKNPHDLKDDFNSRLVSWVLAHGEGDAVIAGAREGFSALIDWMDSMERPE